jgi:hypothetical protein
MRDDADLDRREFVKLASAGAGLFWTAPRLHAAAIASAGSPAPRQDSGPAVQEVAASSLEPAAVQQPSRQGRLPSTGTELGLMTTIGAGAIGSGVVLRHVGKRLDPTASGSPALLRDA